jgi:NDP-4-keto-2,6-dideoxyhexose 3-C-methyltransferase
MKIVLADIDNTAELLTHLGKGDEVLDIGCNDGTLLASYKTRGIYKFGFDPAENLRLISRKVSHKVIPRFFWIRIVFH